VITLPYIYKALGGLLAWVAWQTARDPRRSRRRRVSNATFWALLAALFVVADALPKAIAGALVLAVAALAGLGGVGDGARAPAAPASSGASPPGADGDGQRAASSAARLGHRLLWPVLAIPLGTLVGALGLARVRLGEQMLLAPKHATLISLGLACALALVWALRITGERGAVAVAESRRLLDAIGWAALLPILLAMLGGVLARAEVGAVVAELVKGALPVEHRAVAVIAYGGGMALLTMIMGNAFAAFPVMTLGVGLPLLVRDHGANPAAVGAIGMLTGYCGTLMTPMAANFNVVPVALLGLRDAYAVIKAQVATAVPLLLCNLVLMYVLAFW
jgi:uncharacterized membrane protein